MVNKVCSTSDIRDAADANNRSYVTHDDKSWEKKKTWPAISTNQTNQFICDIDSIKYSKIHEEDPHEASTERRILHLELFSENIPSIPLNKRFVPATFYVDILNLLNTCV